MAEILKGAPVAEAICENVRERSAALRAAGCAPTLALVRVGANDADVYYERGAMKRCQSVGVDIKNCIFPEDITEPELIAAIEELNRDDSVHGVLIFRPLPRHISDSAVCNTLTPDKDVDGITEGSMAGVFTGSGRGWCPCTAEACATLLDHYGVDCTGKRVCVVGRSLVIGKPVSQLMLKRNATVTVCHTRTVDLPSETKRADVIIAAAGHIGTIGLEHISPRQIIVDVGTNTGADGKLCGDADFADIEPFVGAITPVPGGVGSITTAILALHTVEAAEKATGLVG